MSLLESATLRWCAKVFGDDVTLRVFAPLLADWHSEARASRTPVARLMVSLRWTWAFARTTAGAAWHYGVRSDRGSASVMRALGSITVFGLAGTIVLLLPFMRWWWRPGFGPLVVYVIPQALGIALPFALLPGAMSLGATAAAGASSTERRRLVALVALVVATTAVNLAWVMPLANQAWRIEVAGHDVRPGVRELTLQQLWSGTPMAGITPAAAVREVRTRLLLSLAWPVALATLGWRIGRHRRSAGTVSLVFWWVFASAMVGVVDGWRHVVRELPLALTPVLWIAIALLFRGGPGPRGLRGHVSTQRL